MSVYLFTETFHLLLFLLMCGTLLCGRVCAKAGKESSEAGNTIDLFTNEDFKSAKRPGGQLGAETVDVKDFYCHFLLLGGDYVVALAGVNSVDADKTNINILTKYIDTSKDNKWKETVMSGSSSAGGWKTELLVRQGDQTGSKPSVAKGFIAVAKSEKEIYFLLVNCTNEGGSQTTKAICKFKIDVGKINGETIAWTDPGSHSISSINELKLQLKEELPSDKPIFGTAFLTHDQKIIFVLQTKATENKNITALVRSKDANNNQFEVLPFEKLSESCHPYIFPWNEKLVRFTPDCKENVPQEIKESTDIGDEWKEIEGPFSFLAGFLVDKRDFITLLIGDKEVLFFTQEIEPKASNGDANKYLWISDGNRATKVGKIKFNAENTANLALLYHKEELFLLAQNCKQDATKKVCLTRLDEHMAKIKSVLTVWKTKANNIQIPCTAVAKLAVSCSTDGLVDFLSVTTGSKTEWKSEYLNVVVTMNRNNGASKVGNGFKFSGAGAGAVWTIGEQNKDQPYNFIASGFTLVSTVKIENNDDEKDNSLLGIVLKEEIKHIGLWCSKNKKWTVKYRKGKEILKESLQECEQGITYSVAIVLRETKLLVYINWEEQTNLNVEGIENSGSQNINHFYFGAKKGENAANTDVTVSNVLLYNKPFTLQEIEALKPKQNKIDTEQKLGNTGTKKQNPEECTTQTDDSSSDTSPTKNDEKEGQSSPPPTTEDSAVRVGVVKVLCFMLFGVFTLLGRYVY